MYDTLAISLQKTVSFSNFSNEVAKYFSFTDVYLEQNSHSLFRTPDNSEIKTKRITEQNSIYGYDIDGISGIASILNKNWLKKPIRINFKKQSLKKICNNGRLVQFEHGFLRLKTQFHLHLGSVEISSTEKVEFYIFINRALEAMLEKDINQLKNQVESFIKSELISTMKSERLLSFRKFYKNLGVNKAHDNMIGYFDDISAQNFLVSFSRAISPYKPFLYFEVYNCKHIFNSTNYNEVVNSLSLYFDLSQIALDLDICTSVYVKNEFSKSLFLPKNFLDAGSCTRFTLFNCDYLNSFNFKTVRLNTSNKGKKVKLNYNGISKINFYNEAVRVLIPKSLYKIKFPRFSMLKALQNYFGNDYSLKLTNKYGNYIEELREVVLAADKYLDMLTTVRLEMTIKSFNLQDYHKEMKRIISYNIFHEVDTRKVKELICSGCSQIMNELKRTRQLSLKDIAKLVFNEIYFFEFCIRGGQNLHILPRYLNDFIRRPNETLQQFSIDNNILINDEDAFNIVEKLFINSKLIIPSIKFSMIGIIDLLREVTSGGKPGLFIVQKFIDEIATRHKFSTDDFFTLNSTANRVFNIPIKFEEVYNFYFNNTVKCNKKLLYSVLHNAAIVHCRIPNLKLVIKEAFSELNVLRICYPNENENRYFLREIDFQYASEFGNIKEKVLFLKSSVISGKFDNISRNQNTVIKYSNCEQMLLYIAFERLHGKQSQSRILSDFRLPFYLYADLNRLYNLSKNLRNKLESKFGDLSLIVESFNIHIFNIFNFIRFLNANSRYFNTPESIKLADQVLSYAHGKSYIEMPDGFYFELYRAQKKHLFIPAITNLLQNYPDISSLESIIDNTLFIPTQHSVDFDNQRCELLGVINLANMLIDILPTPNESFNVSNALDCQLNNEKEVVMENNNNNTIVTTARMILDKLDEFNMQLLKEIALNAIHGLVYLKKLLRFRVSKYKKEEKNKIVESIIKLSDLGLIKYDAKWSKIKMYSQTICELSKAADF